MRNLLSLAVVALAVPVLRGQGIVHVDEDFDAGIPAAWTVVDVACPATNWFGTAGGYQSSYLDGTEFAFIDSDAAGQFCLVEDYLESPVFDASGASAVRLSFDHYFRFWMTGTATVQVFDGAAWVDVSTYTATVGAWGAPDHQDLDLSDHLGASMQVRFKYTGNWDWWWALDNVLVYEPQPPVAAYCTAGSSASGCAAALSAAGAPSATASSGFVLSASGVEGAKDGLYFFGANGRQANPWGNGTSYQCVVPPVARAGLLAGTGTSGLCDGAFAQDLNALWCPTCPRPLKNPGAGALVQAQLWYRDPLNTSNQTTSLSDALEFTVGP